jgi:two-component system, NarL family, nitrate/nitrite response regulator NarL
MIIRNNFSHQRAPGARNQADEQSARAARVLLADDHPIVLDGLRALLRPEPGVEVVATAPDGASALELIRAHEPHMAVLDINMPKLTGLDVLESLEQDGLATRVIFLTGTATDEQIAAAVERGAWGFLLKEHALDTLIQCLRTVAACRRWLPEEVVAPAIRRATERREKDVQLARVLTAREYEIAGLVAQGLSNKHIARVLDISEGTVKIHLHNTFEKLGGANRTSLAVLAAENRQRVSFSNKDAKRAGELNDGRPLPSVNAVLAPNCCKL